MNRRDVLIGASGALAAAATSGGCTTLPSDTKANAAKSSASEPTDFVLVHGAWHGGWCWDPVRPALEADGHRVLTPTLPGLAERAGELDASIGLREHIESVIQDIEARDLRDFVLVGHSYGGMVVTGIADALKDRIRHIVYLDAAVPRDGESMISYGEPRPADAIKATADGLRAFSPDGVALPPFPPALLGIPTEHPLHDWVAERLTAHPLKTWLDPISLSNEGSEGLARTYVLCTDPILEQTQFPYMAKIAASDPSWRYRELKTGHDAMVTDPDGVAAILLEAAALDHIRKDAG